MFVGVLGCVTFPVVLSVVAHTLHTRLSLPSVNLDILGLRTLAVLLIKYCMKNFPRRFLCDRCDPPSSRELLFEGLSLMQSTACGETTRRLFGGREQRRLISHLFVSLCPPARTVKPHQDSSHFEVIELLGGANRPLTLRLRRVGRERLLRRRAEMRALTRPQGVVGNSSRGRQTGASAPVAGAEPNRTGPIISPSTTTTTTPDVTPTPSHARGHPPACLPPPPPSLPPTAPLPSPPPRQGLIRQDGDALSDQPGRSGSGANDGTADVAGGSSYGSSLAAPDDGESTNGAGDVKVRAGACSGGGGETGSPSAPVGTATAGAAAAASVAQARAIGSASGGSAREQVAAAAAAAGLAGNWEAVEWAESCLLTVRRRDVSFCYAERAWPCVSGCLACGLIVCCSTSVELVAAVRGGVQQRWLRWRYSGCSVLSRSCILFQFINSGQQNKEPVRTDTPLEPHSRFTSYASDTHPCAYLQCINQILRLLCVGNEIRAADEASSSPSHSTTDAGMSGDNTASGFTAMATGPEPGCPRPSEHSDGGAREHGLVPTADGIAGVSWGGPETGLKGQDEEDGRVEGADGEFLGYESFTCVESRKSSVFCASSNRSSFSSDP